MNIEEAKNVKTKEQARQLAINWQSWASEQDLSYMEIFEWQNVFRNLAYRYDLLYEFRENGII